MKSKTFTMITLFAVLGMSIKVYAEEKEEREENHHHYKRIDLDTFGGPMSINQIGPALNNEGTVIGMA